MKKKYSLLEKRIENNKPLFITIVIMFIFPIIVGLIYALPVPQFVAVECGDLLGYYATVFGIWGSFYTYRLEKQKSERERKREIMPHFAVNVSKAETSNAFLLSIKNIGTSCLSQLSLYDSFLASEVDKEYTLTVTYLKTVEEEEKIKPDFNINMDNDIIDADGYPKYVQLLCDDIDGHTWDCSYYKINDCGKIYYYPRDIAPL